MMKLRNILAAAAACSVAVASMALTALSVSAESYGTAYLCISAGTDSAWKAGDLGGATADIVGNGQYTVSVELNNPTGSVELLLIQTDINVYNFGSMDGLEGSGLNIAIDSIKADGNDVAYTGPSDGALATGDDGTSLRMNILNTWGNSVSDMSSATAVESTMEVTFTVSGLPEDAPVADTATEAATEAVDGEAIDGEAVDGEAAATEAAATEAAAATTTKAASTSTSSNTGDAGVAMAVAGLTLAGAVAYVTKKR